MGLAGKIFGAGLALIALVVIAASVSFLGWILLQVAQADGKIDYCYTEIQNGAVLVQGHRNWREDRQIASFQTVGEADTWRAQKCPH